MRVLPLERAWKLRSNLVTAEVTRRISSSSSSSSSSLETDYESENEDEDEDETKVDGMWDTRGHLGPLHLLSAISIVAPIGNRLHRRLAVSYFCRSRLIAKNRPCNWPASGSAVTS